ncbi:LytR/AlgR family response regulator transcription factor [Pseudobacter ginsenosidimutans]|uniref:LytTR family two component transcriptional regulator n=1 Tax=Pseudobacter ginsenosidimutans TaxID=661488 RepID=A0A4Q7N3P7_9BACT|nr:LytTR family DNA-binding domain-containing protein [Pseudobacter ginsenosidimutans]QEC44147.1 response regulator transcription factor [Pseudobacter ginsenosidimutans]RZS75595.1 LytTR family two component transcriptional regulator [Pseudobacter ginsenosidimutans]
MTTPIRCIITDDEPMARKGLQGYIEKTGFLTLTGVCEDALQLNQLLKTQSADLLFLDIEMPYLSGIDFLKNAINPPRVIFTTAYDQYALSGYELDVLDYLWKPIAFERFLKAANKAYDYFRLQQSEGKQDYLFVKVDNRLEKLFFAEILFAEAMENYVRIYTESRKLIIHSTMRSLLDSLPAVNFIQPHKSYIINLDAIRAIEGNVLHIREYQVPVSKYLREAVMEKIINNRLLKK